MSTRLHGDAYKMAGLFENVTFRRCSAANVNTYRLRKRVHPPQKPEWYWRDVRSRATQTAL